MANQDIIDYINLERGKGVSDEIITKSLASAGWQTSDVTTAFESLSNMPVPQPTSVPQATDLIREAVEIFKEHWLHYVGFALLPAIFSLIIGIIVAIAGVSLVAVSGTDITNIGDLLGLLGPLSIGIIGLSLLTACVGLWTVSATMVRIRDRNETIGFMEIMSRSFKYVIPMIVVTFLVSIIVMGGYVLFIIPGMIFSIWFTFATVVVIFDGETNLTALLKSKAYISGNVGVVFGRWLVIGLIYIGVIIVYGILSKIIVSSFSGAEVQGIVATILQTPLNIIITIMTTILGVLMFSYVKKSKPTVVTQTTGATKAGFIAVGVLGLLSTLGIIGVTVFALSQFSTFVGDAVIEQPSSLTDVLNDNSSDFLFTPIEDVQFGVEFYKTFEGAYPETLEHIVPDYATAEAIDGMLYTPLSDGIDYELCDSEGTCVTSLDF